MQFKANWAKFTYKDFPWILGGRSPAPTYLVQPKTYGWYGRTAPFSKGEKKMPANIPNILFYLTNSNSVSKQWMKFDIMEWKFALSTEHRTASKFDTLPATNEKLKHFIFCFVLFCCDEGKKLVDLLLISFCFVLFCFIFHFRFHKCHICNHFI